MTLGDAAFDKIVLLYRSSETSTLKMACLRALVAAPTEALAQRLLEASVNPSLIRTQDTAMVIRMLASSSHLGARLAWSFLQKRWDDVFGTDEYGVVPTLQSVAAYMYTDTDRMELMALLDNQAVDMVGNEWRESLLEGVRRNAYWVSTTRAAFVDALLE